MNDYVVHVPKPSRAAYNPNRPLSGNELLQSHVKHMAEAENSLPADQRTGVDITAIRTEGEAAAYIGRVTALLHPQAEQVRKATE